MKFSKEYLFFLAFFFLGIGLVLYSPKANASLELFRLPKTVRTFTHRPFRNVCNLPGNHFAKCNAKVSTLTDGVTPLSSTTPVPGSLSPGAFHTAYQLPCAPGQLVSDPCTTASSSAPIVAIVDAFHAPNIESDLNTYSTYFGIPSCTKANGCLTVVNQNGGSTLPTTVDAGWAMETSLDVEVAHAICQTCRILLVEANTNFFSDLATAVNTAASMGAVAISNSYGGSEWSGEKNYDSYYNHPGVAVTVSAGDSGYGAEFPAASPHVVAVGGTTLNLFTDLTYSSETVWNGSGSGCSSYEAANLWQTALTNWGSTNCFSSRAIADISADADPNTGAAIFDSTPYNGQSGWWQIGGTSLSSPIIAAAYALGNPIGSNVTASSVLYANYNLTNFHDVTSGSNGTCATNMCKGGIGYDGPSGLGSLQALGAFGGIVAIPTPTPTPSGIPTPTATPTPTPTDIIAPKVSITSPLNGSRVWRSTKVTIKASASDNVKVAKVEFYVNNVLLSTDTSSPYSAVWRVPSQRSITYTLTAKAYDTSGNTASSSVNVTSR
ncbi:MAG: Ig-like domain-containing protein [Candidatus Levyibacteriota bacterium]